MINILKDKLQGKTPRGKRRSSKWSKLRKKIIKRDKRCAICGSTRKLTVHHIIPFHIDPSLELENDNLVVLCENKKYGINCHLLIGHLGNFRKVNNECIQDIQIWNKKLQ